MKEFEKKARAYALKNAISHEGKANTGAVISALFNEGLKKEEVKEYSKQVSQIVNEVNNLTFQMQEKEFEKLKEKVSERPQRVGLPELPNVTKEGVIMRFAPSPSGPMHIGHAATGMPSSLYVKKYGGKFYLRIEDTNPENIDPDSYEMIAQEANWLFGNVTKIIIQSERMQKYYDFAKQLLEKDFAYICTCDSEKFKKFAEEKKECPCRNLSVKENIERWEKMLDKGGYKEGEAVLRFKTPKEFGGMQNLNPAMRDFPLARIVDTPHPRQGKKYRVWPLMNLCVTLDDKDFGSTHIIRAKEHMDNAKRQAMIFNIFGWKNPETFFLGRYNFDNLEISCSKTKQKISEKRFRGWSDIRLPFLAAIIKRGYQPEAFAKMAEDRGLSEVDKVLSKEEYFKILDDLNREIIKEKALCCSFEKKQKKSRDTIGILMPDAKKIYGKSELVLSKLKEGSLIYFKNFGYCRYNPKEETLFWFAHK
jgi:glutamyl-tRNA synthetase